MSNLPDPRQMTSDIVESFPEARAREVAGVHMRLEVRDKKFGWFMENHHGDGRLAINCKALPGIPESMVAKDPVVYHIPKYVGKKVGSVSGSTNLRSIGMRCVNSYLRLTR